MPSDTKRMKVLPSTMREDKRYLLVKERDNKKINSALMDFLGSLGWAKAGPQLISLDSGTAVSVERSFVDAARTALELEGIKCIGASGTISKLNKKFSGKE